MIYEGRASGLRRLAAAVWAAGQGAPQPEKIWRGTITLIQEKAAMAQEVTASADSMARAIVETGRVAVYGIYFDFNKSELKPESKPTLDEISKLLGQNPQLKLHVVGHTDNVGEFGYNMTLSQARAEAVVKRLLTEYKISAGRLKPSGVGPLCPVAANATDEGRAKNRRVELVAQ
jgi:outer membrane protein OmpA-like peptidoglycan-associated protein